MIAACGSFCQAYGVFLLSFGHLRVIFAEGVRLKYVNLVTDSMWATSPDSITWKTLVAVLLRYDVPRSWYCVTNVTLPERESRDQEQPFKETSRRGFARFPPVRTTALAYVPPTPLHWVGGAFAKTRLQALVKQGPALCDNMYFPLSEKQPKV